MTTPEMSGVTNDDKGNNVKRLVLVAASLVLVGGMTAACGGSPDDASKDEFCKAMMGLSEIGDDKDKFEDARDKIKDTGTPKEIDGDARKGFEVFVDALDDVDSDDLKNADEPDIDGDDQKNYEKFQEKFVEVCVGDVPTGLPTDGAE